MLHHPGPAPGVLGSKCLPLLANQDVGIVLARDRPAARVEGRGGRHHQRDPLVVGDLGGRTPHGVLPVQEPGVAAQHGLHVSRKLPHDGAVEARIAGATGHLEVVAPRERQEHLQDPEAGPFAFPLLVFGAERRVPAGPGVGRLEPEVQRRVAAVANMVSLHKQLPSELRFEETKKRPQAIRRGVVGDSGVHLQRPRSVLRRSRRFRGIRRGICREGW